jgi:hypothetical protein
LGPNCGALTDRFVLEDVLVVLVGAVIVVIVIFDGERRPV